MAGRRGRGIHHRRNKQCGRKIKHETEISATGHAYALKKKQGTGRYATYKCAFCGKWHVGRIKEI
jgi:hypothetical protein